MTSNFLIGHISPLPVSWIFRVFKFSVTGAILVPKIVGVMVIGVWVVIGVMVLFGVCVVVEATVVDVGVPVVVR